jgi:streptogramin lyase
LSHTTVFGDAYPEAIKVQIVEGNVTRFERLGLEEGLSELQIYAISQDSQGFLWIGTQDGLNRYDGHTFTVYRHDPDDPLSLSHDLVRAIHADAAGNVWIGTSGGLNRIAPGDATGLIRYQHDEGDPHSIGHGRVYCSAEDGQGDLWIGTDGGLNRFDPQTGQFTAYRERHGSSNDEVPGTRFRQCAPSFSSSFSTV